jgi:nucleoside-diphosphate-sugar epimerase
LTYIPGMLRLRKKPPAGIPNINAGQPWSDMDLADLNELVREKRPVEAIADFLCRPVAEVEAKLAELRRIVDADRERAELGWRCP